MDFEDVLKEKKSENVNWSDKNVQTGFDPSGFTGDYGGDVLATTKKKRKRKKKHVHVEEGLAVTGTGDVVGMPTSFEAYAVDKKKRKKLGGLVRRNVKPAGTKIN